MHFRPISMLAVGILAFPALLAGQVQRDSAGIRIIENRDPRLPAARMWRVDPQPLLHIGGSETDSLYEFLRVMGVVRLTDGRLAIGVQGSHVVRFFDAQGRFVSGVGRRGDGPGEFRQILNLSRMRGDTLVVHDLRRLHFYTADGRLVRTRVPQGEGQPYHDPQGHLDDGSSVAVPWANPGPRPERAQRWADSTTLFRMGPGEAPPQPLGRYPRWFQVAHDMVPTGVSPVFGPRIRVAAAGNTIYVGFPEHYEIKALSPTGRVERIIRRIVPPRPVPRAVIADHRTRVGNAPGEGGQPMPSAMRERRLALLAFADNFAAYSTIKADRTGHLWVLRYEPWEDAPEKWGPVSIYTPPHPTEWDVFAPEGAWLGTVTLPAHFVPTDIGNNYLAGVWRDADDLEYVRVYRLTKP